MPHTYNKTLVSDDRAELYCPDCGRTLLAKPSGPDLSLTYSDILHAEVIAVGDGNASHSTWIIGEVFGKGLGGR